VKIKILHVGKIAPQFLDAVEHYSQKISRYANIEFVAIKQGKELPPNEIIALESERILKAVGNNDLLVALSEEGKTPDSIAFAKWFEEKSILSKTIVFAIGGAYGLDSRIKKRADLIFSLSKMTFQHDVALAVLVEQIYRTMTILRGEEYHK